MELWPWQQRGIDDTIKLLSSGVLGVAVTSPTGMGKGKQIEELALYFLRQGGRVGIFTNRKMLTKQTGRRFFEAGIPFGYCSAEHGVDLDAQLIIASVQTVDSRVRRKKMDLPKFDLIIVDEAHRKDFDKILDAYNEKHPGTAKVGYTATPVGLVGRYGHLVVAGTKREARKHVPPALVACQVFAPSEPDMKGVRLTKVGEYVHNEMVKRVMQCTVFADVFEAWKTNGGPRRPTVLWAPGVPESRWFVDEFRKRGYTAEHIDGETSDAERQRIEEGSRNGTINIVSSFGVLREGIDWPWLSYGIFVQVCGLPSTYYQMVGRILRVHPGKVNAILQDHAGMWHRHGSPNDDYDWDIETTDKKISADRKKKLQSGEKDEGICCPNCHGLRIGGPKCPHCGYEHTRSVRMVRTESGQLVQMLGPVTKRKRQKSPEQKVWSSALYRCAKTGRTFAQALGLFHKEFGWDLPSQVTPQPCAGSPDWDKKISEVMPWLAGRSSATR